MSAISTFQTQLVSIMDTLAKTAVLEISKLVDIEYKVLRFEVTRSRQEIRTLQGKLQLMENMLQDYRAQRQGTGEDGGPEMRKIPDPCSAEYQLRRDVLSEIKREIVSEEVSKASEDFATHEGATEEFLLTGQDKQTHYEKEHLNRISVKEEPLEVDLCDSELKRGQTTSVQMLTGAVEMAGAQAGVPSPGHLDNLLDPDTRGEESKVIQKTTTAEPLQEDIGVSLGTSAQNQERHNLLVESNSKTENTYFVAPQRLSVSKTLRTRTVGTLSGDKRFVCTYCAKRFKCFSQLEIHQRSHTGEKPFKCMLCGKRYAQRGHLYTHQRTHTGEKPYRCLQCGKGFIQKCTLDKHQLTHTGERPFICLKCGKGFTKKCNLNKHQTVHTDLTLDPYRELGVPRHQIT